MRSSKAIPKYSSWLFGPHHWCDFQAMGNAILSVGPLLDLFQYHGLILNPFSNQEIQKNFHKFWTCLLSLPILCSEESPF